MVGFAIAVAAVAAAIAFRDPFLTIYRAVLGGLVVLVGLAPTLLRIRHPQMGRSDLVLMPFVGLFYAVFFGLPVFLSGYLRNIPGYRRSTDDYRIEYYTNVYVDDVSVAALALLAGGLILYFACMLSAARFYRASWPRFQLPSAYAPRRLHVLLWLLAIGNLAYLMFPAVRGLPSVGQFLQPVGPLAMGMFLLLFFRKELPWWQAGLYFLFLVPAWAANQFGSGFLTTIILSGSFLFAIYVFHFQRNHLLVAGAGAAAVLIFVLSYPVLTSLRSFEWEKGVNHSIVEKILLLPDAILWAYDKGSKEYKKSVKAQRSKHAHTEAVRKYLSDPMNEDPNLEESPRGLEYTPAFTGLIRRISLVFPYSRVVESTPDAVPFWAGETYKPLVTSWIPRAVWPGKPEEKAGNVFGRRYGIISEEETGTSVNIPWVTEMYANFGAVGVVVGMSLAGIVMGLLQQFLVGPGRTPLEFVVGSAIVFPLFYQESNFTLMTGSLVPLAISLWLYFQVGLRGPTGFVRHFSARKKAPTERG